MLILRPRWTVAPPGSSVHGMLQAGILEWLHALLQGIFPTQGLNPASLTPAALAGRLSTTSATWEALPTGGGGTGQKDPA